MVRLLIPLIAIVIIWLLFFSSFSKRLRISLSIGVLLLSLLAFWLDMNSRALRTNLLSNSQVQTCGIKGEFSYRSNFNLDLCVINNASKGLVKRLEVRFDAVSCELGKCVDLQSRTEILNLEISPGQQVTHRKNLEFDRVPPESEDVLWTAEISKVWAIK